MALDYNDANACLLWSIKNRRRIIGGFLWPIFSAVYTKTTFIFHQGNMLCLHLHNIERRMPKDLSK